MNLRPEQALRQALLLKVLENSKDPDSALLAAWRMERFVLEGKANLAAEASTEAEAKITQQFGEPSPGDTRETKGQVTKAEEADAAAEDEAPRTLPAAARKVEPRGGGGKRPRWTESDEALVAELWKQGISVEEIASRMGRTTASVYARSRKLDIGKERRRAQASVKIHSSATSLPTHGATQPGSIDRATEADSEKKGEDEADGDDTSSGDETESRLSSEVEARIAPQPACNGRKQEDVVPAAEHKASWHCPEVAQVQARSRGAEEQKVLAFTVETVVQFLRSRDYKVFRKEDGRYEIDGNRVATAEELVHLANLERSYLGKPEFAADHVGHQ